MNYDLSYLMDKESASAQNPHKKLTCIWPSLRLFVSLRSEKKLGHTHTTYRNQQTKQRTHGMHLSCTCCTVVKTSAYK